MILGTKRRITVLKFIHIIFTKGSLKYLESLLCFTLIHKNDSEKIIGLERVSKFFAELIEVGNKKVIALDRCLGIVELKPTSAKSDETIIFLYSFHRRQRFLSHVYPVDLQVSKDLDCQTKKGKSVRGGWVLTIRFADYLTAIGRGC